MEFFKEDDQKLQKLRKRTKLQIMVRRISQAVHVTSFRKWVLIKLLTSDQIVLQLVIRPCSRLLFSDDSSPCINANF